MEDIIAGFIGFGLIGGSIAKAMKKANPNVVIKAFDHHKTDINPNLKPALSDGTITYIESDFETCFQDCDLIFLCAPVLSNIEYLKRLANIIKPSCLITDVGSVKGNIHNAAGDLSLTRQFIGGHPMTGSEKTGYLNSDALLMENAYYVLTPCQDTPKEKLTWFSEFVKTLGSIPVILEESEHDDIVAAISHLPHIIAASLVNLIQESDNPREEMRLLAAGGFKDITRIASSSPCMWQNICLSNTDSILKFLNCYMESLQKFQNALENRQENTIIQIFNSAKEYRNSISSRPQGLIQRTHEVYVDLIDEAGAIATIATILASNSISIKNIGILHNREFEEGILRIEFYEEEAAKNAIELLKKYSYNIYER